MIATNPGSVNSLTFWRVDAAAPLDPGASRPDWVAATSQSSRPREVGWRPERHYTGKSIQSKQFMLSRAYDPTAPTGSKRCRDPRQVAAEVKPADIATDAPSGQCAGRDPADLTAGEDPSRPQEGAGSRSQLEGCLDSRLDQGPILSGPAVAKWTDFRLPRPVKACPPSRSGNRMSGIDCEQNNDEGDRDEEG